MRINCHAEKQVDLMFREKTKSYFNKCNKNSRNSKAFWQYINSNFWKTIFANVESSSNVNQINGFFNKLEPVTVDNLTTSKLIHRRLIKVNRMFHSCVLTEAAFNELLSIIWGLSLKKSCGLMV